MNEIFCDSIQISLKFVPEGPIDNTSVLVLVMPLPEAITSTKADLVQHRIYTVLGGDELKGRELKAYLTSPVY